MYGEVLKICYATTEDPATLLEMIFSKCSHDLKESLTVVVTITTNSSIMVWCGSVCGLSKWCSHSPAEATSRLLWVGSLLYK